MGSSRDSSQADWLMCTIEGCPRKARSRRGRLCGTHYQRQRIHGTTDKPSNTRTQAMSDSERFESKIDRTATCWLWLGSLTYNGYGRFSLGRGTVRAHRYAYELWVGPIPEGLTIDHVRARGCTSRACVNPEHLEAVPIGVNVLRGDGVSAVNAAKTHCIAGHSFDEHGYTDHTGARQCRICTRERSRAYIARNPRELKRRRFTEIEKSEIRHKHSSGELQKSLAIEYGCSQSSISNIVRGL